MMGVEKTRFREGGRECPLGGLPLTTPSFLDKIKGRQRLTASKRPRKQSICAHDLSRGLRFSSQRSVSLIPSASGVNTVITPGLSSTTISVFKGSMNKFTDETTQYEKETRVTWHFNPNSPCIIPCFVYFRSIYFPLGRQKLASVYNSGRMSNHLY